MSHSKRFATWILQCVGRRLWGFPPRVMPAVVDQLGAFSALWWGLESMLGYERAREQLGPLRTHLLATGISLLHGSSYCAYGHAYAFELIYFQRFDRLFPLDEHELVELRGLDDITLRTRFDRLLWDAGLPEQIPVFDRMMALATGRPLTRMADDDHVRALVDMFAVLSLCSRRGKVKPDHAHDPINKDTALIARYQQHRSAQRMCARISTRISTRNVA